MDISSSKQKEYVRRLLLSRMRILMNSGFYGLLLMHVKFGLDEETETAYTDGVKIAFNPKFLEKLNDRELDFILMHEILHIVLEHCFRGGDKHNELFNVACDIVVNSNILKENDMDLKSITIFGNHESMHLTPNGEEGYKFTAEEVYGQLIEEQEEYERDNGQDGLQKSDQDDEDQSSKKDEGDDGQESQSETDGNDSVVNDNAKKDKNSSSCDSDKNDSKIVDDHDKWGEKEGDEILKDAWKKNVVEATEAVLKSHGNLPLFAERVLKELKKSTIDWRSVLNNFIQEEIVDYSFTPPDSRYDSTGFFLPSFSEKDETVEDVLFMIDTSGSISDDDMTAAFSEIKGAIDQFDGKLKGWLGFFDTGITEPIEFCDENEFKKITPKGGGGTSFECIFNYVKEHMEDKIPVSIIILTDGYAPFPEENESMGIPVLWLINNDEVTPPWGKIARFKRVARNFVFE